MVFEKKDIKLFSERLKLAIPPHYSATSFAKEINVSPSGFRKWLNAKAEPSRDNLIAIAEQAGVSLEWLATGKGDMLYSQLSEEKRGKSIPVVGFASCGLSMGWQNEEPLDYKIIAPHNINDKRAFAVLAKGKSMLPEGIVEGSTCIVSPKLLPIAERPVYIRSKTWHNNKQIVVSSIKRFEFIDNSNVTLSGWLAPDDDGKQERFEEKRKLEMVDMIAPVVCIFEPECPPVIAKDDDNVEPETSIDIPKLTKCLEAVEKQNTSLDAGKKVKIAMMLYQRIVKNGNIDKDYLAELIFLASS